MDRDTVSSPWSRSRPSAGMESETGLTGTLGPLPTSCSGEGVTECEQRCRQALDMGIATGVSHTRGGGDGATRCQDPHGLVRARRAVILGQQHSAGALRALRLSGSFRSDGTVGLGRVVADA